MTEDEAREHRRELQAALERMWAQEARDAAEIQRKAGDEFARKHGIPELPPETAPSVFNTAPGQQPKAPAESAMDRLRRANEGTTSERSKVNEPTEAELGIPMNEFLSLRPELRLQLRNEAVARRRTAD